MRMATSLYKPQMLRQNVGTALVVASEERLVQLCLRAFKGIDVFARHSSLVREALDLIHSEKFEAFVFDTALDTPFLDLLSEVRTSPSNKHAMIFAVAARGVQCDAARKARANFVLEKPVSPEILTRTLRAAHGMILREYRRHFRHPVQLPVAIQTAISGEIKGETVNLSEEGIAMRLPYTLPVQTEALVRFHLTGHPAEIVARGQISWADENKVVGLHFRQMPGNSKAQLHEWLSARVEEMVSPAARKSLRLV
jgi:DNA-binding response OmpR family regulator